MFNGVKHRAASLRQLNFLLIYPPVTNTVNLLMKFKFIDI